MGVMFTKEAEERRTKALQERRARKPVRWDLLRTVSLAEAVHFAIEHGWGENKVQVKAYRMNDKEYEYFVEPYERECHCPNLLRYSEYVGGGEKE